jgi:hypothetical protein
MIALKRELIGEFRNLKVEKVALTDNDKNKNKVRRCQFGGRKEG